MGANQVTVNANSCSYVPLSFNIFEHYKNDTIVPITLKLDQTADSLSLPIYLPASPFSYNGINVVIDTLLSQNPISRKVTFNAYDSGSGGYLYNLKTQNVFLYENSLPIDSFDMMKDTSGGKSNLDVVFVLDVTGSMSEEIEGVKKISKRLQVT